MPKKAWFFKNKTVLGILGVVLVFAMFTTGCPNGTTDPPEPTPLPTYTVTFDVDGGSAVDNQTVEEGKTVAKPANPTKAAHTFANWYRDTAKTTLWNFDTDVIVQATTIYAKWVTGENVPSYKVTFDVDGGAPKPADQTVLKDEPVEEPAAKPTKTGFIFDGWYNGTTKWNFSTDKVTAATTLKAKWTEAVTVTFNTNGGSVIAPVTVAKGNDVYPSNYQPTRSGYVFDGWYTDEALTKPAGSYLNQVTESLTLYAKWTSTSDLAAHVGVWRNGNSNEAYWLQADGTFWNFYGSDSYFSFYDGTWSPSQISGYTVTFSGDTLTISGGGTSTFNRNKDNTQTPTAATGGLLGLWVNGSRSVELKTNGDAVFTSYSDTLTLKYCVEGNNLHLLLPQGNLVIISIGITDSKLNGFSKPSSDSTLAGIWTLKEGGQDYSWNLKADGSGTFHTLGVSVPFSFTVTEDKRIDGYDYEVSNNGNTLTLPNAGEWDNENHKYVGITFTKAASVPAGSGADGDSRLHGTWKLTQGSDTMTVAIRSDGTMTQSGDGYSETVIWKADGSTFYSYSYSFGSSRVYPQKYSISGSSLTIDNGYGEEYVLTKQ